MPAMDYPGIGGELARVAGYWCRGCGQQIISSVPIERCEACHAARYGGRERHETPRLFEPAPAPMPGQLSLG
jgi:hypothetical protein